MNYKRNETIHFKFFCRRPQQARQAGATGGQGFAHRGGNKEPAQPANIPVAKSRFLYCVFMCIIFFFYFSINIWPCAQRYYDQYGLANTRSIQLISLPLLFLFS